MAILCYLSDSLRCC